MEWKIVNEDYLNYLRHNETRIPHSNYGEDKYKPFFGILFETNDFYYVTQISHAKNRHELMKENVDFHKIYHPKNNKLLAVVIKNYICLFDYLFISSQMSAKPYFIGSTGILLLW